MDSYGRECPNRWNEDVEETDHEVAVIEEFSDATVYECQKEGCETMWTFDGEDVYVLRYFTEEEGDYFTTVIDEAYKSLESALKLSGTHLHGTDPIARAIREKWGLLGDIRSTGRGQMWYSLFKERDEKEAARA